MFTLNEFHLLVIYLKININTSILFTKLVKKSINLIMVSAIHERLFIYNIN